MGSKSKQFPCNSALSQLGWRERALPGSSNGPELKEKMTATPPTRNVTSVTWSFSVFLVCDTMTAFSQSLLRKLPDGFLQFYDQEDLIQDEYDWDVGAFPSLSSVDTWEMSVFNSALTPLSPCGLMRVTLWKHTPWQYGVWLSSVWITVFIMNCASVCWL